MLEPEGTVEIKYRQKDMVKTMARLDTKYAELQSKLHSPGAGGSGDRRGRDRGLQCADYHCPFLLLSHPFPLFPPSLTLSPPLRALIIRTEGGRAAAKVEGGASLNHLPPGKANSSSCTCQFWSAIVTSLSLSVDCSRLCGAS